jgi:hypothetical protein
MVSAPDLAPLIEVLNAPADVRLSDVAYQENRSVNEFG